MNGMWICVILFFIQQWSEPVRVSPDTLPDMYPSICAGCWGGTWVWWYNSDHLWSSHCEGDEWSEPILVDTAKCLLSGKGCKDIFKVAWIPWVDSSHYIRLSRCEIEGEGLWTTSPPDERIKGFSPSICSDTLGNIWCVWTGTDDGYYLYPRFYLVSYYDGNRWAYPETLREFLAYEITYTAGITRDKEGRIWVGYNDGPIWVQYYDRDKWSEPESIGTCFDFAYPILCADSIIWISWLDRSPSLEGGISMRYRIKDNWSGIIEFPIYTVASNGMHYPHQNISLDNRGRLWSIWWERTDVKCPHYFIIAGCYDRNEWKGTTIVDSSFIAWGGYPSISYGDNKVWAVWQSEKEEDYNIYVSYFELGGIEENAPQRYSYPLHIYPNPFNRSAVISFQLPVKDVVSLKVYDATGKLVRTLARIQSQEPGVYTVVWNGTDTSGKKVASGVYFCRLKIGSFSQTQKLLLLSP